MLNLMHRQAEPRADIGVAMMQGMEPIQQLGMQKTVYPVEIETFPQGDQKEEGDEPNWRRIKCGQRCLYIGQRPPK